MDDVRKFVIGLRHTQTNETRNMNVGFEGMPSDLNDNEIVKTVEVCLSQNWPNEYPHVIIERVDEITSRIVFRRPTDLN